MMIACEGNSTWDDKGISRLMRPSISFGGFRQQTRKHSSADGLERLGRQPASGRSLGLVKSSWRCWPIRRHRVIRTIQLISIVRFDRRGLAYHTRGRPFQPDCLAIDDNFGFQSEEGENETMQRRLLRASVAMFVLAMTVGLTADDNDSSTVTVQRSDGTIIIPNCMVRLFRKASLGVDRPGIIDEMPFDEGDTVADGDLVVRLRDDIAVANLALATERASSETAVAVATKEAESLAVRLKSFEMANATRSDLVPGTTVEELRLAMEARQLATERAREEVSLNKAAENQAKAELESYRVYSRQAGIVTQVFKREGAAVQQGESIIEVVDPSVARVEGKVHVSAVRALRVGQPVKVQIDFENHDSPMEDEVFEGTIGFIDVGATPVKHQVRIWAQVENRDGLLLDNLTARMTIVPKD